MEDKAKQENEYELDSRQGSGSLLAAARKQQNKTVLEIAQELNLSVTQIKTIELDQTDGLPEPTYVRGYIRSYAKLLGLNSEDVLKNYLNPNWQQTTRLDDIPRGIGSADDLSDKNFLTPAKVSMLLLIAAIGGLLWYSGYLGDWLGSTESEVQGQLVSNNESLDSESDNAATGPLTGTADGDASVLANSLTANNLVLTFSQTSWIDIRDQDDKKLAYKSYAPGETLEVSSPGNMNVFVGNAAGVSVRLNGEEFDTAEHREGVYAKFTIDNQ